MFLATLIFACIPTFKSEVELITPPVWIKAGPISPVVQLRIDTDVDSLAMSSDWLQPSSAHILNSQDEKVLTIEVKGDATPIELPPFTVLSRKIPMNEVVSKLDPGPYRIAWKIGESMTRSKAFEVAEWANEIDFMNIPSEQLSHYRVLMETDHGSLSLSFHPEDAPNHVRNFLDLCQSGFYKNMIFHRVIYGFMIQTGCPEGTGSGDGPRLLKSEFNDRQHVRGVLSMARRDGDLDSGSSQFFICHHDSLFLDENYTAFGEVEKGFETVNQIASVGTDVNDRPLSTISMRVAVFKPSGSSQSTGK